MESFFQPNLTNGTLKELEEDPLLIRLVEYPTHYRRKKQYDNTIGCPKFGMATYTKEIVTIK